MMSNERAFEIWAPTSGRWTPWAKPVLFACMNEGFVPGATPPPQWDCSWAMGLAEDTAVILDLPGAEGVAAALSLAALGYRPVPLYNAMPQPVLFPGPISEHEKSRYLAVDVRAIMSALNRGATELEQINLPDDAPPAFILDANRNGGGFVPSPGAFDNRSVSFTTDFPSANFLKAHSIATAILVQHPVLQPRTDLAHTLLRWQQAGIRILAKRIGTPDLPVEITVARPPLFRWIWQRLWARMGLRRGAAGGFGGFVPEPGSGG